MCGGRVGASDGVARFGNGGGAGIAGRAGIGFAAVGDCIGRGTGGCLGGGAGVRARDGVAGLGDGEGVGFGGRGGVGFRLVVGLIGDGAYGRFGRGGRVGAGDGIAGLPRAMDRWLSLRRRYRACPIRHKRAGTVLAVLTRCQRTSVLHDIAGDRLFRILTLDCTTALSFRLYCVNACDFGANSYLQTITVNCPLPPPVNCPLPPPMTTFALRLLRL